MNNAGLPGTGLGGLFYVLIALWMPVSELLATTQGRSTRRRWRLVATQFSLACAIVASVVATVAMLGWATDAGWSRAADVSPVHLLVMLAAPLTMLVGVVGLRLWAWVAPAPGRHAARGAPRARGGDPIAARAR